MCGHWLALEETDCALDVLKLRKALEDKIAAEEGYQTKIQSLQKSVEDLEKKLKESIKAFDLEKTALRSGLQQSGEETIRKLSTSMKAVEDMRTNEQREFAEAKLSWQSKIASLEKEVQSKQRLQQGMN